MKENSLKSNWKLFFKLAGIDNLVDQLITNYKYPTLRLFVTFLKPYPNKEDLNQSGKSILTRYEISNEMDFMEQELFKSNLALYEEDFQNPEFLRLLSRIITKIIFFIDQYPEMPDIEKMKFYSDYRLWLQTVNDYFKLNYSELNVKRYYPIDILDDLISETSDRIDMSNNKDNNVFDGDNEKTKKQPIKSDNKNKKAKIEANFEKLFYDKGIILPLIEFLISEDGNQCLSKKGTWIKTPAELMGLVDALIYLDIIKAPEFTRKTIGRLFVNRFNSKMDLRSWNLAPNKKQLKAKNDVFITLLEDFLLTYKQNLKKS